MFENYGYVPVEGGVIMGWFLLKFILGAIVGSAGFAVLIEVLKNITVFWW